MSAPLAPDVTNSVPYLLGQIQADLKAAQRSREMSRGEVAALAHQVRDLTIRVDRLVALIPEIEHYADTRRRIGGAMIVIGFVAAAVGAVADKIVTHLWKG